MSEDKINQQEQLNRIRDEFESIGAFEIMKEEQIDEFNEMMSCLENESEINNLAYELLEVFIHLDLSFIELCILLQIIKEEAAFGVGSREHLDKKKEEDELELMDLSKESMVVILESSADKIEFKESE